MNTNHITPTFLYNLERLKASTPEAYKFLNRLCENSTSNLWLSTSTNAHLYSDTKFLAHIKFVDDESKIVLSAAYHMTIREGTEDCAWLLFPEPLENLANKYTEFAYYCHGSQQLHIQQTASESFFDDLFNLIKSIT